MLKTGKFNTELKIMAEGIRLSNEYRGKNFILLSVIDNITDVIATYISLYFSGEIITLLTKGNVSFNKVFFYALLTVGSVLVCGILKHFVHRKVLILRSAGDIKHGAMLSKKALSMNYSKAASAEISALRAKIDESVRMGNGIGKVADCIIRIVSNFVSILIAIFMVSEMVIKHSEKNLTGILKIADSSAFSVLPIVFTIATIMIVVKVNDTKTKKYFELDDTLLNYQIRLDYYTDKVLNENSYGKDIHIFNEKHLINSDFAKTIFRPRRQYADDKAKIDMTLGTIPDIIKAFLSGIVYIFVGLKALAGAFGIGKIITYYGAINKLITAFISVSEDIAYIKSNNIFVKQEINYLSIPGNVQNECCKLENVDTSNLVFEFHNVSFKYPDNEKYVIKNVSFKISPKENIAIVGLNGSGKTTIIKLLCRLYEPTEGYITLNGVNINRFLHKDYVKLFGIVFQDFKLLAFSVAENVAAGKIFDEAKLYKSLENAGIYDRVEKMPKKIYQCLYKLYDKKGIELSGGEAQKIAIARALYKDSPFVIMDEPTASLDPISESEIYEKFNSIVKDKTAIFISHRLSSCKFCDRIIVFDDGKIVQTGTHSYLVNCVGGEYEKMWNIQAKHYVNN